MVLARKEKAKLRKRSSTNRREHRRSPDYGTSDSNERECNNRAKPEVETQKRKKSGVKRPREEEICNEKLRRTEERKRMKTFEDSENDIRDHHVSSTPRTSGSISEPSRELRKASMHNDSPSWSTSRECSHGTFVDDEEQKIEGIAASEKPVMPRTLKKVVRRGEGGSSSSSDDHSLETDMNKNTLVTKKRKLAMKKPKMRFKAFNHASSHSPRVMGEEHSRPKKIRKTKASQSSTVR
ncbi:hypothetical protein FGB62_157g11 [Gracilaria domingensis]|nr:hypothetical protein FGB62_157g11 [Gracilaria domingensis]